MFVYNHIIHCSNFSKRLKQNTKRSILHYNKRSQRFLSQASFSHAIWHAISTRVALGDGIARRDRSIIVKEKDHTSRFLLSICYNEYDLKTILIMVASIILIFFQQKARLRFHFKSDISWIWRSVHLLNSQICLSSSFFFLLTVSICLKKNISNIFSSGKLV